jgi:AraC-like DNA-binding protein
MPILLSPVKGRSDHAGITPVADLDERLDLEPSYPGVVADAGAPLVMRDRAVRERITRFIEQNLGSNELTPRMICRHIGVSRTQLYRLFADSSGVARYIRTRRLLKARATLISSADGVANVAHACGFSSHAHFSRVFKRHFGYTPWQCALEGRSQLITAGLIR